jgi:nucleotide-binding universal stress UspA family protein
MVPHRIMVATDGSEPAKRAEDFAADLANRLRQCEVRLVTVIRPGEIHRSGGVRSGPVPPVERDIARTLLEEAEERIRRTLSCSEPVVSSEILEADSTAKGIVQAAGRSGQECSMIVLGNRGLGGFGRLALGSVSSQVIQEAGCPVVVVKHGR